MHKNLPIFQLDILGLDYQVFMDEEPGNIIVFHLDFEGDRIEFIPQVGEHVSVQDELTTRIEERLQRLTAHVYVNQFPDDWDTDCPCNTCMGTDIEVWNDVDPEAYLTQWPDDWDADCPAETELDRELNLFAHALGNVVLEPTKYVEEDSIPF